MMMKSSPAATFVMSQSQFLLELFVISLDDPTMLGYFHQLSAAGHSINSHSSPCGSFLRSSRWAGRTRSAAKRERSLFLVPSRQETVFQLWGAKDSANCFTETG